MSSARAGDTILLAPGNYGDVEIRSKTFASDVTIKSLDANNPAEVRSLFVYKSSGITIDNVDVTYTPNMTTTAAHSAVRISSSDHVTFKGGEIVGGNAVNGVAQTATVLDKTSNVIGLPTARGVTVEWSSNVRIEASEITHFHKGIALNDSSNVVIKDNEIHDVRTGMISGVATNLTIDGNELSGSHPWNWGAGDHADFIHIWTTPDQVGATSNITIVNNEITQGDGVAILGIYLDDNKNLKGFTNVDISKNLIVNGNGTGVRLENVSNSKVDDNVMLQSSGTSKDAPGIYLTTGSHNVDVSGNLTAYVSDVDKTNTSGIHDNVIVQKGDPSVAGYYTATDIADALKAANNTLAKDGLLDHMDESKATVLGAAAPVQAAVVMTLDTDLGGKLTAKSGANTTLFGGAGGDTITGLGGSDSVAGGKGADFLSGGDGADTLSGGADGDTFNFDGRYITDAKVDTIFDFSTAGGDHVRLHSIDANANSAATNEAFAFIGTSIFHKVAGELRYEMTGKDALVMGDVNGDGIADFQIKMIGVGSLSKTDFVL